MWLANQVLSEGPLMLPPCDSFPSTTTGCIWFIGYPPCPSGLEIEAAIRGKNLKSGNRNLLWTSGLIVAWCCLPQQFNLGSILPFSSGGPSPTLPSSVLGATWFESPGQTAGLQLSMTVIGFGDLQACLFAVHPFQTRFFRGGRCPPRNLCRSGGKQTWRITLAELFWNVETARGDPVAVMAGRTFWFRHTDGRSSGGA